MKLSRIITATAFLVFCAWASLTNVAAKDEWIRARSKNFHLIGNAAEKDIHRIALKLEQFRETFRRVFTKTEHDTLVPINIIVFRDNESFNNFKPLDENGKSKDWVAGYFKSGEDANYIALSAEGEKSDAYRTIFHEYVHFLNSNDIGRTVLPPWYNEGLAEYYETVLIQENGEAVVGGVNDENLLLLKQNKLIPAESFFNTDNYTLYRQGADGAGLFYAQAWATMHYLTHADNAVRSGQLNKFIALMTNGKNQRDAFNEAFQTDYATMERELKKYIEQKNFRAYTVSVKIKLIETAKIQSAPVSQSEAKAALGDLLYQLNRLPEAAALLEEALKADADSGSANTTIGLVKLRQGKFAEAVKYLEKAVVSDDKNYLAFYRHAYALSREGMTDYGFVSGYSGAQAAKMRASLEKAISLNPHYAESYHLLAFINIVRNTEIEQASEYLQKALELAPGNQWYLMRTAEVFLKKEDFPNARKIAQKIYETAPDDRLRVYAKNTVNTINSLEAQLWRIKNNVPRQAESEVSDQPLTEEELALLNQKALLEAINQNLRRLKSNEKRVLGYLSKIECRANRIDYSIKVGDQILKLNSENFDSLKLMSFDAASANGEVGCGTLVKESFAVVSYRPSAKTGDESAGEILSIEFVPKTFKFLEQAK